MPSLSNPPFSYILAHHIQFSVHNFHIFRFASVLQLMRLHPGVQCHGCNLSQTCEKFCIFIAAFRCFSHFPYSTDFFARHAHFCELPDNVVNCCGTRLLWGFIGESCLFNMCGVLMREYVGNTT